MVAWKFIQTKLLVCLLMGMMGSALFLQPKPPLQFFLSFPFPFFSFPPTTKAAAPSTTKAAIAALMLQQQLLMSRGAADSGLLQMPLSLGGNDAVDKGIKKQYAWILLKRVKLKIIKIPKRSLKTSKRIWNHSGIIWFVNVNMAHCLIRFYLTSVWTTSLHCRAPFQEVSVKLLH